MKYKSYYNSEYDFFNESYKSLSPSLHRYPATMIPQIGLKLLQDYNVSQDVKLLEPYSGGGSSFISGLYHGIYDYTGYDLNPLAIMISKAKLTYIDKEELLNNVEKLIYKFDDIKLRDDIYSILNNITNCDFWINKEVQKDMLVIYQAIEERIYNKNIKNLILLAFSTTLRQVSYVRNNEFKLFRIKNINEFKVDSYSIFIKNLNKIITEYIVGYYPLLKKVKPKFNIYNKVAEPDEHKYDVILTSPPYGDSKTTVAYGQFSTFINEWLGCKDARKLDNNLMGGKVYKSKAIYDKGLISDYISNIAIQDTKRAYEVSAFYYDLEADISKLSSMVSKNGIVFFIVSNRKVKNIELPTDRFIAETFENNGLKHIETIQRRLSNKTMPTRNSPTNTKGITSNTMNYEYIIVCSKE